MKRNLLKLLMVAIAIFSVCGSVLAQTKLVVKDATWTSVTDETLGAGYSATLDGFTVSLYAGTSGTTLAAPDQYLEQAENAVLVISGGSTSITTAVMTANGGSTYCNALTASAGTVTTNATAGTLTWSGTATSVNLTASATNRYDEIDIYTGALKPGMLPTGTYYIRNVSEYTYMAGANNWGTKLSLKPGGEKIAVTLNDAGTYSMQDTSLKYSNTGTHIGVVSGEGAYALWIDQSETQYTITKLTQAELQELNDANSGVTFDLNKDYYTITWIEPNSQELEYFTSGEEDNCTYKVVEADPSPYGIKETQVWEFFTPEELAADLTATATEANPMCATSFANDPDFSRNRNNGVATATSFWTFEADNKNISGANDNYNCESYHTPFNVYQTISGLPNGNYIVTAQTAYRDDSNGAFTGSDSPVFYVENNGNTVSGNFFEMESDAGSMAGMSARFTNGQYTQTGLSITIYNHQLTVGFKGTRTDLWCIWDNVQLEYYGPIDISGIKQGFEETKATAAALLDKPMSAEAKSALENVSSMTVSEETSDAYTEAIDAINTIISSAQASISVYEQIQSYTEKAAALDKYGQKSYENAGVVTKYNAGAYATADEAYAAYIEAVKAQKTEGADMTALIVNPEINGSTGWTCLRPYGGNGPLKNNTMLEFWGGNASSRSAASFNYYQTITGLSNGVYTIGAMMFNSTNGEDGAVFKPCCGVYGTSSSNTVVTLVNTDSPSINESVISTYLQSYTVDVTVTDGTLTLGVKADTLAARWFVADNFTLTYSGGLDLTTYYDNIKTLTDQANSIKSKKMNNTVMANLLLAYTKGKDVCDHNDNYVDEDELDDITSSLTKAISDATNSIGVYESIQEYFTKASNLDDAGKAKFNESAAAIQKSYSEGNITDGVEELAEVKEDYIPAIKAQTTPNTEMTEAVKNSDCTNGLVAGQINWGTWASPIGWGLYDGNNDYSLIDNAGCFHVNCWSTEGNSDGSWMTVPFAELWNWKSGTTGFTDNLYVMHDEETGYNPGTYHIEVRARLSDMLDSNAPTGFSFYANDIQSDTKYEQGTNNWYAWYKVDFIVDEDGKINFGFRLNNANFSWLSFKTIKLYFVGNEYTDEMKAERLAKVPGDDVKMNKDVREALNKAVEDFKDSPKASTDKALSLAISAANISANMYSDIKDDIEKYSIKAQDLDKTGNYEFEQSINEVSVGYDKGTLTENNVSEIYMEAVKSQGAGADMTELIVNAGFETGTTGGWTIASSGTDIGARAQSNATYTMSSTDESYTPGDYVFNAWNGDSEGSRISQVISGLQNGTYTLSAWVASHHDNVIFIFGNDSHEGASTTTKEIAVPVKVSFMVEDGTATIGAVGADGTSSVAGGATGTATEWDGTNGVWYKVDDFHLTFDGSASVDGYLTQLEKTIEIYEPYLSKAMNADAKAPLEKAINEGKAANTSNTIAEVKSIIAAIEAAAPAAEKSMAIYEKVYVYQQKADSILDADGRAMYYKEASQIIEDYNNGVITDGEQEQKDAAEYYIDAVKAQTTENSDMTEAVRNHSFENGMKYWATKSGEGYVSLGNVIARNSSWTGCDGMYYAYKQNKISTTQTVQEYQSISGLPAGYYSVKANIKTTSGSAELRTNSYPIDVTSATENYELYFYLDEEEDAEISIKAALEKGQYIQIDNFELTYLGSIPNLELAEGPMQKEYKVAQDRAYAAYKANNKLSNLQALSNAIKDAKASVKAYATAYHYLDSAKSYMYYTNVYSQEAYDYCIEKMKELQTKYDSCTLKTEEAYSIMDMWTHSINGTMFANFYNVAFNTANYGTNYPDYPIIYYMHDAWRLVKDSDKDTEIAADANFHSNTWSTEGATGNNASGMTTPFIEYWTSSSNAKLESGKVKATAIDLAPGLYKFVVFARTSHETTAFSADELKGITLHARTKANANPNDDRYFYTDTVDLAQNGTKYTDQTLSVKAGMYELDSIIVRKKICGSDLNSGTAELEFEITDTTNITWLAFKFPRMIKVRDLYWYEEDTRATDEEIDSLNSLIALHNKKTIGFAASEYATYANKDNIKSLKNAKAYMQTEEILEDNVLAYIKQLNKPWIQNYADTNAIYNPRFALWYDDKGVETEDNPALTGWEAVDNTVTNPKTGANGASTLLCDSRFAKFQNMQYGTHPYSTAARMRFYSTAIAAEYVSRNSQYHYGTTEGYEMPLKQSSTYYIAAQYGCYLPKYTGKAIVEIRDSKNKVVKNLTIDCDVAATDSTKALPKFKLYFNTNDDEKKGDKATENYTVVFRSASLDQNFDLVISNMELYRSPNCEMRIVGDAHYGTYIAPFETEIPDGVQAYVVTGVSDELQHIYTPDSLYDSNYRQLTLSSSYEVTYYDDRGGKHTDSADMASTRLIPAHVPVIIYSETDFSTTTAGRFNKRQSKNPTQQYKGLDLSYKVKDETTGKVTAYLQGTYGDTIPTLNSNGDTLYVNINPVTAPNGSYILQRHNGPAAACFYEVDHSYAVPTVGAFHAYLVLPEDGPAAKLRICSMEDFTDMLNNATIVTKVEGKDEPTIVGIYSVSGTPQKSLQKGVNILKMSDGSTRKQYVK